MFIYVLTTLVNFRSIAITFSKAVAKIKFEKISNEKEVKDLAASHWIFITYGDIQILRLALVIIALA